MQRAGLLRLATAIGRRDEYCTYVLLLGHFDGIDQRKMRR